jgi:[ribosomal protein S18]-alanine N-acetyltransferase
MAAELKRERAGAGIRMFRESDITAVAAILREAPEAANWTEESYREALNWPGLVAFVSEGDAGVAGLLIARQMADEAEILNVAVMPEKRRRGEGSAMLKAALEEFRARGASRVFLEVRESNEAGIGFYQKRGFFKTGRRAGYYREPDEAAIVMQIKLAG